MAKIIFYDATELDQQQLTDDLKHTDHYWEFVHQSITPENCDVDAEVISVFVTSVVTREMIEQMPKLRLIACRSTGFNNIDLTAAAEHNISVVNVPTYGESTVAEYAFALILHLMRKISYGIRAFNEDIDVTMLMGNDLAGKTIGIIGTGHIGLHAAQIANGFGMTIIAYDPFPNEAAIAQYGITYVTKQELLVRSDIVSIHAPYTGDNRHLIDADALSQMKSSAILINTARGELVDTAALTQVLNEKQLAGVALDVVEGENLLNLHEEVALLRSNELPQEAAAHSVALMALHKLPNVIVTPHTAFNTIEAIQRINQTTCQNIIRYWYGEVPNKVKPPKKRSGKLVIVRHTESEWNATGQWTGITDVHLSEKGFHEAALLGRSFKAMNISLDKAFCSQQIRTLETLEGILNASGQLDVPIERVGAINERDYGEYTGKNKWQVQSMIGEEAFQKIRRGWDEPVPGGETLKMVYERAVPFYKNSVVPLLLQGENVLIVAHGNSIRALMKYIESLSDEAIVSVEMLFGQFVVYDINANGHSLDKKMISVDSVQPPA
jgi:D-lactate dehydrogenase